MISLSVLLFLAGLFPFASNTPPLPPVLAKNTLSQAEVTLVGAKGETPGIYLGEGIILTSWQHAVAESLLWDNQTQTAPPLRYQLSEYINDGIDHRWEQSLFLTVCPVKSQFAILPPDQTPDEKCFPYNLATGMRVRTTSDEGISIQQLLYASREYDIALLQVDVSILQDALPELIPARLNSFPLESGQVLRLNRLASDAEVLDEVTTWTPLPTLAFESSAPRSPIVRLQTNSTTAIPGTPVYNTNQEVVGLVWATLSDSEVALSPVNAWYNHLWQINDSLQNASLEKVLHETILPDAIVAAPTLGDVFSPELGNAGIDVLHYTLDLAMFPDQRRVAGTAQLSIKAITHHLAGFSLDLSGMTVTSVAINGSPADFETNPTKLFITLPQPVVYGTLFDVVIAYSGIPTRKKTPYSSSFTTGIEYIENPPRMAFVNQPDGANTWFPCNDHPSDRATYTFNITVPDSYTAVANGEPLGITAQSEGLITYHWQMDSPMMTALAVVAVGDYVLIEDTLPGEIPLRHYAYAGTENKIASLLSSTEMAFEVLAARFGPYPYESYGHVITPLAGGALETQTMTVMPIDLVSAQNEAQVYTLVVHELAHHWYGNTVSLKSWQDIWLNEGFATYAEWLALEARYGEGRYQEQRTWQEEALNSNRRITPLGAPLPSQMFDLSSYEKGAWVLHMLREKLGDAVFFRLLQTWAVDYAARPVTSYDFFQLAEQISGQDLTLFRHNWLETGGEPSYTIYWATTGNVVELIICSRNDSRYRLDIPLRFVDGQNTVKDVSVSTVDPTVQTVLFSMSPVDMIVDPDQHILGDIQAEAVQTMPSSCLIP